MIADREDFAAKSQERRQERTAGMLPAARLLAGASPVMGALTNDENWNRFLTLLQGIVERTKEQAEVARAKLADPSVWAHEDMLKLKADILVAMGMVQALEFAINLPKAIMEGAEEAQILINEYEAKRESAEQPKP